MDDKDIRGAIHGAAKEMNAKSGQAQALIEDVADRVTAGVAKAGDQASAAVNKMSEGAIDAYDRASDSARRASDAVVPFVHDRPYAALAISAALGLVVGVLMTGRGPRVVYMRPNH